MAKIVLGIGTSHSPMLTLAGEDWHNRAQADRVNKKLSLADGSLVDYDELVARRGERYSQDATPENFAAISTRCQDHLDRIAAAIRRARPDVIVIVGDDQSELYSPGNTPAIALYYGAEVKTHSFDDEIPAWLKTVAIGYGMDETHVYPGHPQFAEEVIRGLIDRDIDVGVANAVPDPDKAGFGHAFGFPAERLFSGAAIPMVPVMLNTYYPPNVMSPSRCHDVGLKLREAIEAIPGDLRVAVLASGGLSHFVVEEEIDQQVLKGLADPSGQALRALPREALLEGSSEVLNWILVAGTVSSLPLAWTVYEPIRRTPAGTGIGCAFAIWEEGAA